MSKNKYKRWTKKEDTLIKQTPFDGAELVAKALGRTVHAVNSRRSFLGVSKCKTGKSVHLQSEHYSDAIDDSASRIKRIERTCYVNQLCMILIAILVLIYFNA